MLEWKDVKEATLGQSFEIKALHNCCKGVYGGVCWPGKRPGFAVVIAMDRARRLDSYDVCLLGEYESFDIRELVRQCGALDLKYLPDQWIGDRKNDAADQFLSEMNNEPQDANRRQLNLSWTSLFDMEQLYPYILAEIRRLLASNCRQLFLKESRILGYLSEIRPGEIVDLEQGDYPAIEALALAVIEMRRWADAEQVDASLLMVPDYIGI